MENSVSVELYFEQFYKKPFFFYGEVYIHHLSLYSLIMVMSSDAMDNKSIQQSCLFLPGSTLS